MVTRQFGVLLRYRLDGLRWWRCATLYSEELSVSDYLFTE
jgi:hypothetical protein